MLRIVNGRSILPCHSWNKFLTHAHERKFMFCVSIKEGLFMSCTASKLCRILKCEILISTRKDYFSHFGKFIFFHLSCRSFAGWHIYMRHGNNFVSEIFQLNSKNSRIHERDNPLPPERVGAVRVAYFGNDYCVERHIHKPHSYCESSEDWK